MVASFGTLHVHCPPPNCVFARQQVWTWIGNFRLSCNMKDAQSEICLSDGALLRDLNCKWKLLSCYFIHGFLRRLTVEHRASHSTSVLPLLCRVSELCLQKKPCYSSVLSCHTGTPLNLLMPLFLLCVSMQVNSRTGFRVQENNFYVPQVKLIIIAYWSFNTKKVSIKSCQQHKPLFFCFI